MYLNDTQSWFNYPLMCGQVTLPWQWTLFNPEQNTLSDFECGEEPNAFQRTDSDTEQTQNQQD